MKKQRKCSSSGEDEEKILEASTGVTYKYDLSDKEFRNGMLKMFNELKVTMEQAFSKLKEDMK